MFILDYALPIAFFLLLLCFYSLLPDLRSCRLPQRGTAERGGLLCHLPVLLLTLAYALTAFSQLGNRESPESFEAMQGQTAHFTLTHPEELSQLAVFHGVGAGSYELSYVAEDGSRTAESLEQSYIEVLKWQFVPVPATVPVREVEILCTAGSPWLGEIFLLDADGQPVPAVCDLPALCDEQAFLPESSHFMNSTYFDEIYHARTAWEHRENLWPYEISHPPLGKLILGMGIELFGMTPFGWRFMGTLCGVLMLPLMYAFLRRLFGGTGVPFLGTLVFATDFMHFVQTRIATIDSYSVFFILLMYYFMYLYLSEDKLWALALSGVSFGLGAACKWICLYAGAGLGVLWLLHWLRIWRESRAPFSLKELLRSPFAFNCGFCLIFFVAVPALIYYLSYFPYGSAQGCRPFSGAYTRLVLENQQFMFRYHEGVTAEHPYSSRWYQWLLNIRPILYYLEYFDDGSRSSIAAFLNPALCWGGLLFLPLLGYTAIARKDRRAAFILLGFAAQLLPWVFIRRVTFAYHYFPSSLFLVLAVSYVFAILRDNRKKGLACAGAYAAVSLLLFLLFYPALSGAPVNNELGTALMGWLPTWPL